MIMQSTPPLVETVNNNNDVQELATIIADKINRDGPLSFCEFMEIALYYPSYGYYTSPGEKIGQYGDFYTSTYLSPLFGHMVAMQLEELWSIMGTTAFTIVEYGAGPGTLCQSILSWFYQNKKERYSHLSYYIIEISPQMREKEKAILPETVNWISSINEIPPVQGCVLSNELLDNFPVHKITMQDELMEIFIDHNEHGFIEVSRPASEDLKQYLANLGIDLPRNSIFEINLLAVEWLAAISRQLSRGFIFTIDYGYSPAELTSRYLEKGTIQCYRDHHMNLDPYSNIGQQDITSFVNFRALEYYGELNGMHKCGLTSQQSFLHSLGFAAYLYEAEKNSLSPGLSAAQQHFLVNSLMLSMGRKFKILIQQKGIVAPPLSGMKFSFI